MSTAFVVSHGMDFIHDYSFDIAQDARLLSAVNRM